MKVLLRTCVTILFFFLIHPADAENLADPQSGCQLPVPDDWSVTNSKNGASYSSGAANADQTESVNLFVVPENSQGALNDDSDYVKWFVQSCLDHGATVLKREHQTVNGVHFYVLHISSNPNSTVANLSAWLTSANGQIYQIGLFTKDTDPGKNPDLTAVLNSFSLSKK
jgi:hypothetical protein